MTNNSAPEICKNNARICFSYFWKILLSQERPTLILQYLHVNIFWIVHSDVIYWLFGRLLLNTFGKILKKLWLISTHVPNKQTGNSFLWKTIKHIDPNKTHRLGKKGKKEKTHRGFYLGKEDIFWVRCIEPNASGNFAFLEIRESSLIEI